MKSKSTLTKIHLHCNGGKRTQFLTGMTWFNQLNFQRTILPAKAIVMLLLFIFASYTQIFGQSPYTSVANGNWNVDATWSGTGIPTTGDVVNIAGNFTVTVTANAACASITFPATATTNNLIINSGITLAVSGAVTIPRASSGDINTVAVGAGILNAGSIAFTNGGTGVRHQMTISTGTVTVTGNVVGSATNTSGTISFTGAGLLRLGGTIFSSTDGTLTTFTGSTVEYNAAGAQTIGNFNYRNLTLSGSGLKTLPATASIGGDLILSGTATTSTAAGLAIGGNLVVGAGTTFATGATNTWTLGVAGSTSVSGTLTLANTATKTFTGNVIINSGGVWNETGIAAVNFAGNLQHDGTTFTANTGVQTFSGSVKTISGTSAIAIPSLTISGTTTNNGSLTVSTTLAGAGTLTNGATGILNFGGGSITPTLTATAVGNIVNYTGASQTVKATPYNNLTLSGSGTKTLSASTVVAGNLTINGSAQADLTLNANTANTLYFGTTQQIAGTWGSSSSSAINTSTNFLDSGLVTVASGNCVAPAIGLAVGGAGAVCSGSGTNITVALSETGVSYQLRNGVTTVGSPVTGTTGTISLLTGNLTSVTTFNVLATNISTSCEAQLTGTATVTVNPLPNIALTVGGGGQVCSGSGTNITVGLSETGVTYQLRNGLTPVLTPVVGTGSTINLPTGNLTSSTTFNVLATNIISSCAAQLTGTAAVTVNAPPNISLVVGGAGSVCSGTGTNITVGLSETGVNYQLRNVLTPIGIPVAGTGGTINLPTGNLTSSTTFNVFATNTTSSCTAQLTGTAAITMNALPNISLTVGGAGAVCTGSGTNITVALSESGVNYQLRNGVTLIGNPVPGTGATINLPTGNLTSGTTFNVYATNTTSSCSAQLTGTAAITVNAPPDISLVVGGAGAVCSGSGTNITVALSETGVNYQLRNGVTLIGSPVPGTGATINLQTGNLTSVVTFNVLAAGSCSAQLTSTATVTVNSLPSVAAIGGGAASVCVNSATPAFTNATAGGVWSIVPVSGGSASITQGGVVTGLGAGTVAVTYTVTSGCSNSATQLLTINASVTVAPITGTTTISIGSSTLLACTTPGGIWTSGTPTHAIVNSSTGEVTGIADGTTLITYTVTNGSGCAGTSTLLVTVSTVSGIEDLHINNGLSLKNHPNPFTGSTTISYTLPSDGRVTLTLRNLAGQIIKTIVNEMETEGAYTLNVELSDLQSGVYFGTLSLKSNGKEVLKTIRMLKGK